MKRIVHVFIRLKYMLKVGRIMKFNGDNLLLYAVTDRSWTGKQTLKEQMEEALIGGVTCVQLREKELDEKSFLKEAIEIRELCHKYKVPFLINDNVKVAIESKADGVHVGQSDLPVSEIRKIVSNDFIIGATAKTVEQAQKAEREGANYLGVGAVFPSPTKKEAVRISKEQLKEICDSVSIPAVAIGGINLSNMNEISGCGMNGVAVISAIFAADDIKRETQELKRKVISIL